jgi:hypothetical protein
MRSCVRVIALMVVEAAGYPAACAVAWARPLRLMSKKAASAASFNV